ncbi:hypothetical protein HGRIS_001016, partial [Hohenbuehelia grisea]
MLVVGCAASPLYAGNPRRIPRFALAVFQQPQHPLPAIAATVYSAAPAQFNGGPLSASSPDTQPLSAIAPSTAITPSSLHRRSAICRYHQHREQSSASPSKCSQSRILRHLFRLLDLAQGSTVDEDAGDSLQHALKPHFALKQRNLPRAASPAHTDGIPRFATSGKETLIDLMPLYHSSQWVLAEMVARRQSTDNTIWDVAGKCYRESHYIPLFGIRAGFDSTG